MNVTAEGIAIAAFFLIGGRLAILYLERLDSKSAGNPGAEAKAIAASRRRARGHLWLLGAMLTALVAVALPFGRGAPPLGATVAIVLVLLGGFALCVTRTMRAYRDARRLARSDIGTSE
ncbi:MAG TPA: hypothetical protein VIT85_03075, partial [Solirubrobacterales bacterium]